MSILPPYKRQIVAQRQRSDVMSRYYTGYGSTEAKGSFSTYSNVEQAKSAISAAPKSITPKGMVPGYEQIGSAYMKGAKDPGYIPAWKRFAHPLAQLREFGNLGKLSTDTALGQTAQLMRNTAYLRSAFKNRGSQMTAAKGVKAPGQFQLGNMQGARVRSYQRRMQQLQKEEDKKKLQRVEMKERIQREAPRSEPAGR